MSNGKGSKQRPAAVSDGTLASNWDRTFRKTCDACNGYGWLPGGPEGTVCTGICEKCDATGCVP